MKKLVRILGVNFLIGIGVFLLSEGLFNQFRFESIQEFYTDFLFYQLYCLVIGSSNMLLFSYLNNREWKNQNMRAVIGVFLSFILTVISLFLLRWSTALWVENESTLQFLNGESTWPYVFGGMITVVIVLGITFFYIYKSKQEKRVKESELVAKTVTARFESLKSQLDPHFLFNSLNVLTSLIGENPERAEDFTTKLSQVYRYVLEQKSKDLIPLSEELNFAKKYMDLIMMRFEDSIQYEVIIKDSVEDYKIVPLTLQLLLENCIKHNRTPMQIKVEIVDAYLEVSNSFKPKETVGKGTKIGLSNIKKRYDIISSRGVEISSDQELFSVRIPLLKQQAKVMQAIDYNNQEKFYRAKARVKNLREFYSSLISFIVIMPFLAYINYSTYWGFQWFWFACFGWGLGLAIQGFKIYGIGQNWESKQIKKYMDKNDF